MNAEKHRIRPLIAALTLGALAGSALALPPGGELSPRESAIEVSQSQTPAVFHRTAEVRGVKVFYREAGEADAPVIVLLHGFPTSSHMFRDLIPELARDFRVIAPDYPGFGNSDAPDRKSFEYSFENLSLVVEGLIDQLGVESAAFYVMDYGAPVGYRIFSRRPELVHSFIIQNGNAYEEGLREFWDPIKAYWAKPTKENRDALRGLLTREATQWQYTHGTRSPEAISPDNWNVDQPLLDRPGNNDIQLDLFLSYGTNVSEYPKWQAQFREHQPSALIVWGKNDHIFPADGATPYLRDLTDVELHLLDTGHFALEEDGDLIAERIRGFLGLRLGE